MTDCLTTFRALHIEPGFKCAYSCSDSPLKLYCCADAQWQKQHNTADLPHGAVAVLQTRVMQSVHDTKVMHPFGPASADTDMHRHT